MKKISILGSTGSIGRQTLDVADITKDYETKPMTIGGGTYAKFIKNAVAYGPMIPGREDVCHIANEYMFYEDFIRAIEIYAKAIYELRRKYVRLDSIEQLYELDCLSEETIQKLTPYLNFDKNN